MDVEMRDAAKRPNRRGASARSASAPRRSDPYARDARQRPAPSRARQDDDRSQSTAVPRQTSSGMAYPPPQLNIKGSSGPTWIVISNLAIGTSAEDIALTFGSFGKVSEVKSRPQPGASHPSVSYEVAFEHKHDADLAVEKFHGALADGRVLSVSVKKTEVPRDAYSQFSRATAQAAAQRPRDRAGNLIPAPGPAAIVAAMPVPTGPAAMKSKNRVPDLLDPRAKKGAVAAAGGAAPTGPKATQRTGPVKSLKDRIPEPLANRLLTPAQAQKLRTAEAKQKAKAQAQARAQAVLGAQKGKTATGKGGAATPSSLKSRISVPLTERLAKQAGTPKSDLAAQKDAEKKKKKRAVAKAKKKAAANGGAGMEVDA